MSARVLTPTSYLVLGLVHTLQPCTSYDMKQLVNVSIGMFWPFPHSQLYAEPVRLVAEGHLTEIQEEGGRRRRLYRLTASGEEALRGWLHATGTPVGEVRDEGLLKLFFAKSGDRDALIALAADRVDAHGQRLALLSSLREEFGALGSPNQMATIELGLRWETTAVEFWSDIAEHPPV